MKDLFIARAKKYARCQSTLHLDALKTPVNFVKHLSRADVYLLAWFAGFCVSLFLTSLFPPWWLWCVALTIVVMCLREKRFRFGWMVIFILALAYANLQFAAHKNALLSTEFERQSLTIIGTVRGLPRQDDNRIRFDFAVTGLDDDVLQRQPQLAEIMGQRLRLNCYRCWLDIAPGQRWRMTVRLKRPRGFASWGAFDYEKYLFRHQIVATGYVRLKETNVLLAAGGNNIHVWRAKLRNKFSSLFTPGSAGAGMFNALMLGDRSLLSNAQRDVFQVTGVSHLMAISGLHVGLVFLLMMWLLRFGLWPFAYLYHWIPRQQLALIPSFFVAFGYAALAGFAVSTQRALLMLAVYVVCRMFARDTPLLRVLLLAVAGLLAIDPFSILDTGFWLSCFAVLLIAVIGMRFKNLKLWQLQPWLWAGMLPITALLFGKISLVSPFVNLLVVPLFCLMLIPIVLVSLALALLGQDIFSSWLAQQAITSYEVIFGGLEWLSQQWFAFAYPQELATWQAVIIVALLFLALIRWQFIAVFTLAVMVSAWPQPLKLDADEYFVTTLDVGQGLAMVIEAQNHVLVYDTGPAFGTGFSTASAVLLPYLRARGIQQIDHLIISHADNDHIGGLSAVLDAFPVQRISTSRMDKMPTDKLAIASSCQAGERWRVANVDFSFHSPEPRTPQGSNNLSCVLKVANQSFTTLITGDIEKPVERYLLATRPDELKADFMLVPHQGSKTSSTAAFLDVVAPRLALLAAGYRNHYGHPHDSVVRRYDERGIELISTIESGSILLKVNNKKYSVTRFRQAQPRFWRS